MNTTVEGQAKLQRAKERLDEEVARKVAEEVEKSESRAKRTKKAEDPSPAPRVRAAALQDLAGTVLFRRPLRGESSATDPLGMVFPRLPREMSPRILWTQPLSPSQARREGVLDQNPIPTRPLLAPP